MLSADGDDYRMCRVTLNACDPLRRRSLQLKRSFAHFDWQWLVKRFRNEVTRWGFLTVTGIELAVHERIAMIVDAKLAGFAMSLVRDPRPMARAAVWTHA